MTAMRVFLSNEPRWSPCHAVHGQAVLARSELLMHTSTPTLVAVIADKPHSLRLQAWLLLSRTQGWRITEGPPSQLLWNHRRDPTFREFGHSSLSRLLPGVNWTKYPFWVFLAKLQVVLVDQEMLAWNESTDFILCGDKSITSFPKNQIYIPESRYLSQKFP